MNAMIPILLITALIAISVAVIGWCVRSVWEEMSGLGGGEDAQADGGKGAEALRDAEVVKENENWRNGRCPLNYSQSPAGI